MCICTIAFLSTHLLMDIYVSSMSIAAMNIGIHVSQFWFPRCVCTVVGLLGCMTVLFPVF